MKRKARSLFGAVKVCDITNHRIKWRKTLPHWRSTLLEPRKDFFLYLRRRGFFFWPWNPTPNVLICTRRIFHWKSYFIWIQRALRAITFSSVIFQYVKKAFSGTQNLLLSQATQLNSSVQKASKRIHNGPLWR